MRRAERSPAVANSGRTLALMAALVLPLLTTLAACNRAPRQPEALKEIRMRGELRIVTINSPTTYYLGTHGAEGLEFGLAGAFPKSLGIPLVITPVANLAELRSGLGSGRTDIAPTKLTADEALLKVGDAAQP